MTAAVPADGDRVGCAEFTNDASHLFRCAGGTFCDRRDYGFSASSLENLGIGHHPGAQTAQFVFGPPGIDVFLMFSDTASRARRARGTQTPDLIVAREDSQMAPASRVPASFA